MRDLWWQILPAVATFSDLFARLDADPRVRGKQFEHICKWFLTNHPTYKNKRWTGRCVASPTRRVAGEHFRWGFALVQ